GRRRRDSGKHERLGPARLQKRQSGGIRDRRSEVKSVETGAADCELTVLWLVGGEVPAELAAGARRYGAINVRRSRVAGSDLLHDLGASPVLVVTEDDATANEMLEMGADDVFVMREWAVDAFTRALERAWARARGQRRHDLRLSELLER